MGGMPWNFLCSSFLVAEVVECQWMLLAMPSSTCDEVGYKPTNRIFFSVLVSAQEHYVHFHDSTDTLKF